MDPTVPNGKTPVSVLYDEVAPHYDAQFTGPEALAEDGVTFALLAEAYRKVDARGGILPPAVLDLGCGTGLVLEHLRAMKPLLRTGIRYTGVDVSPRMIQVAQDKFPGVRFLIGDMELLERQFASSSFDLVVSTYAALSYCRHPMTAIHEMARVLRPGGRVFIQVYGRGYRGSPYPHNLKARLFRASTLRTYFRSCFGDVRVRGVNAFGGHSRMLAETRTIGLWAPDLSKYLIVEGVKNGR